MDRSLLHLLELDGERIDLGDGLWVAFRAKRVPPSAAKPHGIDYSLCLIGPDGGRLVCYDNAHPEGRRGRTRSQRADSADHRHLRHTIRPYRFKDAGTLLADFWTDVIRVLKEEGLA